MNQTLSPAAAAALAFEEKILPNGLALRVLPMPQYSAAHVTYTTRFGSINRGFRHGGREVWLPEGTAHFLEHKMFENEDGVDAFSLYAKTGASANAYTSFDRTSYIFTATSAFEQNLDILLSFVGHPHFTAATIQKEQGIIGQEINMYQDSPDFQSYFSLLSCLYHAHPVRDDIAGTVASIATLTPEMLYACTDVFYHPANMALCAAGNITMGQLEAAVARAGLPAERAEAPARLYPQEPPGVACTSKELAMSVAMPLFGFGFKEAPVVGDTTKTETVCDMLTELLAGETSPLYRRLYDAGLVQADFSGEYGCFDESLFFYFSGEGPDPARVRHELLSEIERLRREGIDKEQFDICKKMMVGETVAALESVERVASMLSASYFRGRTPSSELEILAALTPQDVEDALQTMLSPARAATVVVNPV